jgi:hypothetical protein
LSGEQSATVNVISFVSVINIKDDGMGGLDGWHRGYEIGIRILIGKCQVTRPFWKPRRKLEGI